MNKKQCILMACLLVLPGCKEAIEKHIEKQVREKIEERVREEIKEAMEKRIDEEIEEAIDKWFLSLSTVTILRTHKEEGQILLETGIERREERPK